MIKLTTEAAQALLDEARYLDTKPAHKHNMCWWQDRSSCGTTSCAAGDMAARNVLGLALVPYDESKSIVRNDKIKLNGFHGLAQTLSLPYAVTRLLFESTYETPHKTFRRRNETPTQTAARIRKVVYYLLHKQEVFADLDEARRVGHVGVVDRVLEKV